jgi:hypothetical protein
MLKRFLLWLAVTMTGFGALGGGYHFYLAEHPARILVVVDSSFPMQPSWSKVSSALDEIRERPYTEFSLYTEKGIVHGWQRGLFLRTTTPYAPRDWSKLTEIRQAKEFGEATEVVLITNDSAYSGAPGGWSVKRLE